MGKRMLARAAACGATLLVGLGTSTGSAQALTAVIRPGQTLSYLAARYHVSVAALARANGLSNPNRVQAGQSIDIPLPAVTVTVQAGDTLDGLARSYDTTVSALMAANHLLNPNLIRIGSRLVVPSGGSATTTTAGPAVVLTAYHMALPDGGSLYSYGGPSGSLLGSAYGQSLLASFSRWASAYSVPAPLLEALSWWESGWDNSLVSPTGAIGIGQLEPATVDFVRSDLLGGVALDPWLADQNIRMSAVYLAHLLDETGGDEALAVAAYYQGLASIRAVGLFPATRHYVSGVLAYADLFSRYL